MVANTLAEPQVDMTTTAKSMLDAALERWFKELSVGGGNGSLYKKWRDDKISHRRCGGTAPLNESPHQPENTKLNQLKAIEWGPILDAAARLTNAGKFTASVADQTNRVSLAVHDAWPDKNGQTAVDKINALVTDSKKFGDTASQFAAHLQ